MSKKKLIVGLGNPDPKYQKTRHNIGSRIVDMFAAQRVADDDYRWKNNEKCRAVTIETVVGETAVILAKPLTFVNESGKAVKLLMSDYYLEIDDLLLVHDDADILFGKFKLSYGSRSAGHKGVESVIQSLGTRMFWRLRVGIQPSVENRVRAEELVLKTFSIEEEAVIPGLIEAAIGAIEAWMDRDTV